MALFVFTPFSFCLSLFYLVLLFFHFSFDSLELLWIFMELLTFLFIGLIFMNNSGSLLSVGAITYFVTQSILSMFLLVLIFMFRSNSVGLELLSFIFIMVVVSKIGLFPFSSWYTSSVYTFPVFIFLLALTLHKVPLLYLFITWFITAGTICFSNLIFSGLISMLLLNLFFFGSLSNQSSDVRSLLLNTSMANNSWLLISCFSGTFIIVFFVLVYSIFLGNSFSTNRVVSNWSLLALSGLPPFPIFFLNLLVIWGVLSNVIGLFSFLYLLFFILLALLVSYSYLRFVFSNLTLSVN